ncbi:uncharacterized protein LOC135710697 [Ochlerotatus camptorhynchus]|uniref:uncharacterized protein LOC135710697 n=1 Tax=Ochlerotatus camptorhynchus TaxID=644619 RepID=UPI0031D25E6F
MMPDYINKLPTEMLYQVFDCLSFEQQLLAMAVCQRWCQILSSDWYIPDRRLCLCTFNLNGTESQLQWMKQYRAFTIKDSNKDKGEFLDPLRKFLFSPEVAETVEELRLELFWYSLSDLLDSSEEMCLPKLEKISYLSSIWVEERSLLECKVVAPNLKTVMLEDSKKSGNPLIQVMSDQIETMSVRFINKMLLFATIGNYSFTSLNSLTLMSQQGSLLFRESDFHAVHLQTFGRLRYLKISDEKNVFYLIYRIIFREAKNLETLIINGRKMSEDAFNQIDRLKKLQELYLMVEIQKSQPLTRLCLPQLKILTTYACTMTPLGNVSNLKDISIRNHKNSWERYKLSDDAVNCGIFIHNLQTLRLTKVILDSTFVRHISTITGLRALELNQVRMDPKHLQRIFGSLKQLQRVRFEWCYLNEVVVAREDTDGNSIVDHDDDDGGEQGENDQKVDCLRMLQQQYPDCRITNLNNRIVRHVTRGQSMYQNLLPQYWRPL